MLKYKRLYEKKGAIGYGFYPEGNISAEGIIEFKNGEKPKIVKPSPEDVKMFYAIHAMYGIDITKESGTIAWY